MAETTNTREPIYSLHVFSVLLLVVAFSSHLVFLQNSNHNPRALEVQTQALAIHIDSFQGSLHKIFAMSIPNKSHAVQNPLRALFDGFAGSEIFILSVQTLCPDWPLHRHPDLEYIRNDFTSWVNRWFKDQRLRKKIEDLDAPLFAAMAYPETGREQLLTLAKFIAWYFPWDDGTLVHSTWLAEPS